MLMLGTAITFAQVTPVNITVPTVSGPLNGTAVIPIKVDDVTGKGVYSFDVSMEYNKSVIEVTGVSAGDAFATGGQLQHTIDVSGANGKLTVAWARGTVVAGSGTLLNVNITFKTAGSFTPTWTFGFNAGSPAVGTTTIGMVKAASIQVFVDNVTTSGLTSEFLIPIKTTALASTDEVYSFDLNATYDATKLQILGVDLVGPDVPMGAGGYAQINATGGNITLNWARGTKLTTGTAGTLLYLKAKALTKTVSVIDITNFQYNNGTPVAVATSGTITVENKKPVFASATQALTGAENTAFNFTAVATDGDGDVLTYSATGTAITAGATVSAAGVFAWTPSYTQAGTYAAVITATDGSDVATLTLNITVTDVNRTPTISLTPAGPYNATEGVAFNIKATGADVDTDNTVTLSATGVPSGAVWNAGTGDFAWTPNFTQAGSYSVVFTVKDSKNATASVTAPITVTNVNGAPRFDVAGAKQMPDTTILAHTNFVYTFKAIDPQDDPVTYFFDLQHPASAANLAENAIIVPSTGVFGWKPVNQHSGLNYLVVSASDGILTTQSRVVKIGVTYNPLYPSDVEKETGIPTSFELYQNYPNPFNPTTNIKYALPKESRVRINVFNILGQEVATLVNSVMPAGYHSVDFKANNIPSGMYIYKIETESFSQVKKMLLMK